MLIGNYRENHPTRCCLPTPRFEVQTLVEQTSVRFPRRKFRPCGNRTIHRPAPRPTRCPPIRITPRPAPRCPSVSRWRRPPGVALLRPSVPRAPALVPVRCAAFVFRFGVWALYPWEVWWALRRTRTLPGPPGKTLQRPDGRERLSSAPAQCMPRAALCTPTSAEGPTAKPRRAGRVRGATLHRATRGMRE